MSETRLPSDSSVPFHIWPQPLAQSLFPTILTPYLPHSNTLYQRVLAPQNIPSRHCLFASTIPPPASALPQPPKLPPVFTLLFSDRSRHHESQIYLFNPLTCSSSPSTPSQSETIHTHLISALLFVRDTPIPHAPNQPFSPILRLACLDERTTAVIGAIASQHSATVRFVTWEHFLISLTSLPSVATAPLPPGWTLGTVPEPQLDTVLGTSSVPRQRSTLLSLPNVAIMDDSSNLAAWAYIGLDGAFATLYVLPAYRGKGLATLVGTALLHRLVQGEFAVAVVAEAEAKPEQEQEGNGPKPRKAYDASSGWIHANVAHGNAGSIRLMRKLGGVRAWESGYLWLDSEKLLPRTTTTTSLRGEMP